MDEILVEIMPLNKNIKARKGSCLLDVLYEHGFMIPSSCGKRGICGKCLIEIETTDNKEEKKKTMFVNACKFTVEQNIIVYLPHIYQVGKQGKVYKNKKAYQIEIKTNIKPKIRYKKIKLDKENINNSILYIEHLFNETGTKEIPIGVIQKIANIVKEINKTFILIYDEIKIVDIKKEEEYHGIYGLAIDLGTTSIGIELINLESGETINEISELNPQILYGDDVISRISYAIQSRENLELLQKRGVTGINNLISQIVQQAGIKEDSIYDITIAGNTTMMHLLLGVNPLSLGEYPFTPIFTNKISMHAREIGLNTHPEAQVYIFPSIGGFVGGDIVAGLLSIDVFHKDNSFLFIDLGTNGEIVVSNCGKLWATSTAVGPAFEGGRIQCGMRASIGAIERIVLNGDDIDIKVIGNIEPVGMCGSALIDLLSILLKLKIVDYSGRMLSEKYLPENLPNNIKRRVKIYNSEIVFEIFQGEKNKIFLSARDVRQLQLSCSAIKCGIKLLSHQAGIDIKSLEKIYIAGTFGFHLDKNNLKTIGIIPKEISEDKILFIGNSSLAGAKYALINQDMRSVVEEASKKIKHIDLSTIPNFEEEFAMSTFFPEIED